MSRRITIHNATEFSKRDLRKISTGILNRFSDDGLNWRIVFTYGRGSCSECKNSGSIPGIGNRTIPCTACALRCVYACRELPYREVYVYLPKTKTDLPKEVAIRVAVALKKSLKIWYSETIYITADDDLSDESGAMEIVGDTVIHFKVEPEVTPEEKKCHRENRARDLLKKWQQKLKLANTKIKKLKRTIAYYDKRKAAALE